MSEHLTGGANHSQRDFNFLSPQLVMYDAITGNIEASELIQVWQLFFMLL